jgi:hypothetical protein
LHDREEGDRRLTHFLAVPGIEFKKIWTGMSPAIHSARKPLIVGYSLPDSDRTARLVLRRAGPPLHHNRRIEVVDPADQEIRLKDRISPHLIYRRQTFQESLAATS